MSNTELTQFEFEEDFEQKLLAFFVRDLKFFNEIPEMKHNYFVSRIRGDIHRLSSEYVKKHGILIPQEDLKNEITSMYLKTKKKDVPIDTYWEVLADLYARDVSVGQQYARDQVMYFIRGQEMANVLKDGAQRIMKGKDLTLIATNALKVLEIGREIEPPSEQTENVCISGYPKDAIQGWLKEFADLYSHYLESPYPFWIFDAATCLGNIFSVRIKANTSLFVEPRLYMVGLGTSGDTRKSESGLQTIRFFEEWAELYGGVKEDVEEDVPSQNFNSLKGCGSSEGLISRLKISPALVLVYDELRSFVQKSSIKGSNLLQVVNSLFDQTMAENATKDKFQQVKTAHLSLMAFCTTDTWDSLFTPSFLNIGFVNRLWIVPGEGFKKDFYPEPIPEDKKINLMRKLTNLMEKFPQGTVIEISLEAEKRMDEWYKSFERTEFTTRIESYGLRILMIMAVSEGKTTIDLDMAERVISLLDWQVKVRDTYQPQDYTDTMSRIENLIRRAVKKNPWIDEGILLKNIHSARFDSWKVDKAFENLLRNKELVFRHMARTKKYAAGKNLGAGQVGQDVSKRS